jgi:RHS repeat-associated protein
VVVNNDRLMSMAGIDYRYDASGNQISQISTGNKQQRSFNGLNQLVQINVNGKLTQYEYDALGRRSAKITELGRTDFIWDNHQLIGECTLGEYTWYIYQPDTFTPVALIKAGLVYYYHLDQLGTPICLTDDNAQIVWRSQQGVFGQTIESSDIEHTDIVNTDSLQDKIANPIRFQGQYFDDESGLHYNRFRYYSPQQARFIHQDPIGLVGGINHYQYAPNPVNWVDPFGLSCKEGYAIVRQFENGFSEGHFTIEVFKADLSYSTHQVITADDRSQTTIVRAGNFNKQRESVKEAIIELPNAIAAIDLQKSMKNESLGPYHPIDNSCLSHVIDVLNQGEGSEYNKSKRGYYKLFKDNKFERLDAPNLVDE